MIQTEQLVKDMIIDFKVIKKAINDRFDHKFINDMVGYNPTAENISKNIYEMIESLLAKEKVDFRKMEITVWENDNASIKYTE